MKLKKTLLLIVAAVAITLLFAIPASAADYDNHWAGDIIRNWVTNRLITPDTNGNVRPDEPITRAELASLINKVMGYKTPDASIANYSDVPENHPYYLEMALALGAGYIKEVSPGMLAPDAHITREAAVDMFVRISGNANSLSDSNVLFYITDRYNIRDDYKNSMIAAISSGFITGNPDYSISPGEYMTRAEAIVLLYRLNSGTRSYAFTGGFGFSSGNLYVNDVTIMAPDVSLKNVVTGSLTVSSRAGTGTQLNNISVSGMLTLEGGPTTMTSVTANNLRISSNGGNAVLTENGNNSITYITVTGSGNHVNINKGNSAAYIIIDGNNNVINIGAGVNIDQIIVNGTGNVINMASGSFARYIECSNPVQIHGTGAISLIKAGLEASGSVSDILPYYYDLVKGTSFIMAGVERGTMPAKILSVSFINSSVLRVVTEDTGARIITNNCFSLRVAGTNYTGFSVAKISSTEYWITLTFVVDMYYNVAVTGQSELSGSFNISLSSQPCVLSASAPDTKTVNVTINNPSYEAFSRQNFTVEIGGVEITNFTVTPVSYTSFVITLNSAVKSGQAITVNGRDGLSGSASAGLVAAVKSIQFSDVNTLLVNTDDTTGNKIDRNCFAVLLNGVNMATFTVTEVSKTQYKIVLPVTLNELFTVTVNGLNYLTGSASQAYKSPFEVSSVTVTNTTTLTVVLKTAPGQTLTQSNASSFAVIVDSARLNVLNVEKSETDKTGKTYILMVNLTGYSGTLSVNGVKPTANKGAIDFVPPQLISVKMNGEYLYNNYYQNKTLKANASITIDFTKPVFKTAPSTKLTTKDVDLSGAVFTIYPMSAPTPDLTSTKFTVTGNSLIIGLSSAKTLEPGLYVLTIDLGSIYDSGGMAAGSGRTSYMFEIIGTPPTSATASQNTSNEVVIKLSGTTADVYGTAIALSGSIYVEGANTYISRSDISYDSKTKSIYIDLSNYKNRFNNTYKLILMHSSYSDFAVSKVKIDTVQPVISEISIRATPMIEESQYMGGALPSTIKSNAVIYIEFSEPIFATAPSTKFKLANLGVLGDGRAFTVDSVGGAQLDLKNAKFTAGTNSVTITLTGVTNLEPGRYMIRLDTSQIFDSSKNSLNSATSTNNATSSNILTYYFNVVGSAPKVYSYNQLSSGDMNVIFYQTPAPGAYAEVICREGKAQILQVYSDGTEEIIADNITSDYFLWNETSRTLSISVSALADFARMNMSGKYKIRFIHPEYDDLIISDAVIYYTHNNSVYSAVIGNNDINDIAMHSGAAPVLVSPDRSVIRLFFPSTVYMTGSQGRFDKTAFTAAGTTNQSLYKAFTLIDKDGVAIDLSVAVITHSTDRKTVTLDFSKVMAAYPTDEGCTFTLIVKEQLIYDASGKPIGNELSRYQYALRTEPPKVSRSLQETETRDVVVIFNTELNNYGTTLIEQAELSSILRIERNGKTIAYLPAIPHVEEITDEDNGEDGDETDEEIPVEYVLYSPFEKKLTITEAALLTLTASDGTPVTLDGGEYTLVLTIDGYPEIRVKLRIDTREIKK